MSLIHQKLYNSENISTINMPNYIKELVEYLRDSFSLGQRIRFEVKIDPLELDVAHAVPLGLILNEAITNSIKYAFPEDRTGMIYITLETIAENQYLLTISDNGIGFDERNARKIFQPMVRLNGKSSYPGNGLGLTLCEKIVSGHGGSIYAESIENNGARFIVLLPKKQKN